MTTYTSAVTRTYRRSVTDFIGEHVFKFAAVLGVLVALAVTGIWYGIAASTDVTARTGVVTNVDADHYFYKCGKVTCSGTNYDTTVDLGGTTAVVTYDSKPHVGDDATVYETADGDFRGYAPTSAHDIAIMVIVGLIVGAVAGFGLVLLAEFNSWR